MSLEMKALMEELEEVRSAQVAAKEAAREQDIKRQGSVDI